MTLPLIGITTYREEAAWGVWRQQADVLPSLYAKAVEAVGGVPVLLPPVGAPGAAEALVRGLHGLLVAGGADVDPSLYGAAAHRRTAGWRPDRDAWELALLRAADEVLLPVLGICRGMQLMAVHAGGSLEQHVPDRVGGDDHSPGGDRFGPGIVATTPGSRLAAMVGPEVATNCHHHQAVASAPGFVGVAYAPDGTLEAIEAPGDRFYLAVQWHPETVQDVGLFAGLVAAAAATAGLS